MADNGWLWSLNGGKGGYKPGFGPEASQSVKAPAEAVHVPDVVQATGELTSKALKAKRDLDATEKQISDVYKRLDHVKEQILTVERRGITQEMVSHPKYRSLVAERDRLAERLSELNPIKDRQQAAYSKKHPMFDAAGKRNFQPQFRRAG